MFRATAVQNLPINDDLRVRAAFSTLYHGGYQRSGADSADDKAGFLALDFTPNDELSLFLWAHIENKGGKPANLVSKGRVGNRKSQFFPTGDPWDDRLDGSLADFVSVEPVNAQDKSWDTLLIGAEINWRISDEYSLTYIPSYLDFEWDQRYFITHKLADFNEAIDQTTHELRLAYNGGSSVTWMAGLYYYQIETKGQLFIQFNQDELLPADFGRNPAGTWLDASDVRAHELKGLAAFGQATWEFSNTLRFVFGGRVSRDKREANGFQQSILSNTSSDPVPMSFFSPGPTPSWKNDEDWTHVDWKVGVEVVVAEESMLYANIQTGFQPGTFDTFPGVSTEESVLLAFTAGIKSRFLDSQLLVNNEVFYYIYDDLLTQAFDAASGTNIFLNADTIIYGDQLDLQYNPDVASNTQLKLSIGYLHGRYKSFTDDVGLGLAAFEDKQLQNAPDLTVTFGITQDWNLKSGAFFRADITSRYESSYWGNFSHSSGTFQKAYTKTDAVLTYHSAKGGWTFGIWVKNIENQDVQAATATGGSADPAPGAPFLEPPRTFGVR